MTLCRILIELPLDPVEIVKIETETNGATEFNQAIVEYLNDEKESIITLKIEKITP